MEKLAYRTKMMMLVAASIISFSVTAQEVSKDYHKEYQADKNTTLDLSNKYGDITVTAWDKDQMVIDVRVTVKHPDKEKAEKYLEQINVEFSQENNTIYAKTVLDDKFSFTGWWGNTREFKINYTVKMPYTSNLTLANRYGNTDIDELRGLVNLDIKYGNVEVDKLTRGNEKPFNRIEVAYGKATILEGGWLDMYIRYSPATVDKSQALLIDSRYSRIKIGTTSSAVGDSKNDNYNIEKINNLVLKADYTPVTAGTVAKKIAFTGSYGSLSVDEIPAGFESVDVDIRYSGARLVIADNASYQLDAKSSYGGIKYNEDNLKINRRIVENNSSEVTGLMGNDEKTSSTVKLRTSYGTIKLF